MWVRDCIVGTPLWPVMIRWGNLEGLLPIQDGTWPSLLNA